jgi:hypothetical protein
MRSIVCNPQSGATFRSSTLVFDPEATRDPTWPFSIHVMLRAGTKITNNVVSMPEYYQSGTRTGPLTP